MTTLQVGDKVVPSSKASRDVRAMIGAETGTVVYLDHASMIVQVSHSRVSGWRDEFKKAAGR